MTVGLWEAAAQLFVGCLIEGGLELRPFLGCVQVGAGFLVAVCLHENCKACIYMAARIWVCTEGMLILVLFMHMYF